MEFITAIQKRDNEKAKELIENKTVKINSTINSSTYTPLTYAAKYNNRDIVEFLIEKGAKVNKADDEDVTPLYNAIIYNNIDIVKLLVENGADVNKANAKNETPLHIAVHHGYKKIVKILIENGANINTQDTINKYTPLHLALSCPGPIEDEAFMGYLNIAELLIKSTTDRGKLEITDRQKNTPLHKLIGTINKIKLDDTSRGLGYSDLYKAALNIVNLLIENKVNVNAANENGNTPLHRALRNDDFELAYILIEAHANTKIKNNNNKTPLQSIDDADLTRFQEFLENKKEMQLLLSHKMPTDLTSSVLKYLVGKRTRARRPKRKRKKSKRNK